MATKKAHDFEPASHAEIEAAVHPFIERFLLISQRERAIVLFSGRHRGKANDLLYAIDQRVLLDYADEPKAIAAIDEKLPGVYLDANGRAFRARFGHVRAASFDDHPQLFVSNHGICGLVVGTDRDPWLLVRKAQPKRQS